MARLILLRGAMGAGKTTVASLLRKRLPFAEFIEVDDIKQTVHGSSMKCDPEIIFRHAGDQARRAIEAGKDAVVIEPLCTEQHINIVLTAAGIADASTNVQSIWLACTLETALIRKGRDFASTIIRGQHKRYATRHVLTNEVVIRTDDLSPGEVENGVCQALQIGTEQ